MSHTRELNSERALEEAKEDRLTVVTPAFNQLQIDIDNVDDYMVFKALIGIIRERIGVVSIEEHPSRSGGDKKHITINLLRGITSHAERILFQAVLGSDRKRELLNYFQAIGRDEHPVLFLENPYMLALMTITWEHPICRQLNPANSNTTYLKEEVI